MDEGEWPLLEYAEDQLQQHGLGDPRETASNQFLKRIETNCRDVRELEDRLVRQIRCHIDVRCFLSALPTTSEHTIHLHSEHRLESLLFGFRVIEIVLFDADI